MKSLSSVGLGLSVVFGCLLLALIAELYYLLWWKKRFTKREIESDYSNPAREFLYMFCFRRPSSLSHTALNPKELTCSSARTTDTLVQEPQSQSTNKDFLLKSFGSSCDGDEYGDGSIEAELMRLHNLSGPPRFLFTIIEETKEDLDLESEDGKSRNGDMKSRKGSRGRSLSDLLLTVETPYLTPLASPPFSTPPLTPMTSSGFNPLFESSTDVEFSKMMRPSSSPPPKFKFLQDAEEKLYRRSRLAHKSNDGFVQQNGPSPKYLKDEDEGPFITIIIDKNKDQQQLQQLHSSSSQVLPLATSPSTFR